MSVKEVPRIRGWAIGGDRVICIPQNRCHFLMGCVLTRSISDRVTIGLAYDRYENAVGEADVDVVVEATFKASDRLSYAIGVEHQDRSGGTDPGSRTDVAARLTYAPDDLRSVYVFGQVTVASNGLEDNDRYGVGVSYGFENGWAVSGEVSDGTTGAAVGWLHNTPTMWATRSMQAMRSTQTGHWTTSA
jgi:hypothetical protein